MDSSGAGVPSSFWARRWDRSLPRPRDYEQAIPVILLLLATLLTTIKLLTVNDNAFINFLARVMSNLYNESQQIRAVD